MWHLAFIMGVRRGNLSYTSFLTSDYITPPLNQKNMTLYKIFCKFPYWLLTPPVLIFKIEIMNNFRMLCFGNCIVSPSFLDDIFILNANVFFILYWFLIPVFQSIILICMLISDETFFVGRMWLFPPYKGHYNVLTNFTALLSSFNQKQLFVIIVQRIVIFYLLYNNVIL